jgi:succinyl-CoA synthetase beta subunit
MQLKTHQTGPEGQKVRRLLVEEGADIRKELYVGMVVDRGSQKVVLMASSEGGMDIEEVAAKTPEKIRKIAIDRRRASPTPTPTRSRSASAFLSRPWRRGARSSRRFTSASGRPMRRWSK